MTAKTDSPSCASCPVRDTLKRRCSVPGGVHPGNCPTELKSELIERARGLYHTDENSELTRVAGCAADDGYARQADGSFRADRTRIEELVYFCREMNFRKLGLLFCMGFAREAAIVEEILQTNGFTVLSAICKVGNLPKAELGLADPRNEPACNPILQAKLLNEQKTDFNIALGLCVGHDSLFYQYSEARVTTLVVKDRVLAHNPVGAIYCADGYFKNRLKIEE